MIISTLLNIAIFQGIVIGIILLKSPFFKNKTNRYLAFAIFAISWSLLGIVLDITKVVSHYPILKIVSIIDPVLLFPVLVFLFVIHQVNYPQKNTNKSYWLFVPFLISIVIDYILEYVLKIETEDDLTVTNTILLIILFVITFFFIPFILTKTYKTIQYSKKKAEKQWLLYLWSFEVTILSTLLLLTLLGPFVLNELSKAIHILALFSTLIIHWIAYSGVYKLKLTNDQEKIRELLSNQTLKTSSVFITDSYTKRKKIETIQEQKVLSKKNIYYQKLEKLCYDKKIYRNSSLDRNKVAEMLDISPSYVSQIINSITGDNFTNYINHYRVEDVKNLILDDEFENYSLLAIGLECGFSSKTTFHNSFKKLTGMTPNTYRKTHK